MNITSILNHQSEYYRTELAERLAAADCTEDVYQAQALVMREFVEGAFQSSVGGQAVRLSRAAVQDLTGHAALDIGVLYDETQLVSESISESFNASKDFRTRARNRTEYLTSLVSNLNILNNDTQAPSVSFYDGLINYDQVDDALIIGNKAMISTAEGLAHLAVAKSSEYPLQKAAFKLSGNGTAGNYGAVIPLASSTPDITHKYMSSVDAHASVTAVQDGSSATWFEYQRLGSADPGLAKLRRLESDQGNKDLDQLWLSSQPLGETLSLTLLVDLGAAVEANWLDVLQYIPSECHTGLVVNRIYTSTDGVAWAPLYAGQEILDQAIYAVPQVYDITESTLTNKAMSQGTFIFSWRSLRYIQLVLSTANSYTRTSRLGYTRYRAIPTAVASKLTARTVASTFMSAAIKAGPQGDYSYTLPGSVFGTSAKTVACKIQKRIVPVSGWRYAVGLRDLALSGREYLSSSVLVSRRYTCASEITKICLYASEMIPEEFAEAGLVSKEAWIKYSVSVNDVDWLPISPLHHNQLGPAAIAPKFYDFNQAISAEEKNALIQTRYVDTAEPVTAIRLKVEFSRPAGLSHATPILQAYTLRCFTKEDA
jgi:hypothetical protein